MQSFVGLERFLLESPAYRSLGLAARCAYTELARLYTGGNNGRLCMSATTLAGLLKVAKATAGRALQELVDRGFVECVRQGGFNMKTGPRASEFRLTAFRCDVTGQPAAKTFMRYSKVQNAVSPDARYSLTTRPLDPICATKFRVTGTTRDREACFGGVHGLTTGPHIESTRLVLGEDDGGKRDGSPSPGVESWASGKPPSSLATLQEQLKPEMWSWQPIAAMPLRKIGLASGEAKAPDNHHCEAA